MALEEDEMRLNELTRQIEEVRKDVDDRLRGKDKAEAMRARQMHEQTLVELETGLQTTQLKCVELQSQTRGAQENLRKKERQLEEEQEAKEAAAGDLLAAERKLVSARSGVEEVRGALEAVDRARRMQEQELLECREQESDLIAQQTQVVNTVGQLHSDVSSLQAEVGEVKLEVAEAEMRAESNMLRAAQLVEELRAEQGNASRAETEKKKS